MAVLRSNPRFLKPWACVLLGVGLAACGTADTDYPVAGPEEAKVSKSAYTSAKEAMGSVFQRGGIAAEFSPGALFGGGNGQATAGAPTAGIQVNGYLWGAALDAISFMPLETADPYGGIIQSGWYIDPAAPDERFKVNVFILSGELRPDGVRVAVFKQIRNDAGEWANAEPATGTAGSLETVILQRAGQLRLTSAE